MLVYRIKLCEYCSKLYVTISTDNHKKQLCRICFNLSENAKKIQTAYRRSCSHPEYRLCKKRLQHEYDELCAEVLN